MAMHMDKEKKNSMQNNTAENTNDISMNLDEVKANE